MVDLLSSEWIKRLERCNHLVVGFSGGIDSTALLHQLASVPSLNQSLIAIHINHGISSNALSWQHHCEQWCAHLKIPFIAEQVEFKRDSNVEEEARKARYAVFSERLKEGGCLILGHHQDDQAETLLLQLFRGTGVDGLTGMYAWRRFGKGYLARPLLTHSRMQIHDYAIKHQLEWINDESNEDERYSRNYLRKLIPLLTKKWPGAVVNLARTATHCQQAKENLDELAFLDCPELSCISSSLDISTLKSLHEHRVINVLRVWLRLNHVKLPSSVVIKRFITELFAASIDANPIVALGDLAIRRYQNRIYIVEKPTPIVPQAIKWVDFPNDLVINNKTKIQAKKSKKGLCIPPNAEIIIKFRQGGERFVLHKQTKSLKKLAQEWQIPVWQRAHIPLLYVNHQLAAVVGYAVSDLFYGEDGHAVWSIEPQKIHAP